MTTANTTQKKIGFIGLGAMGSAMAERLLSAGGFALTVYNRTPDKADPFVSRGASRAENPGALAAVSDAVMIVVSDDAAVRSVAEAAFAGARPGTVFIDSSTISVGTTRDLAKKAAEVGCDWLDAPVLGSPKAASIGELPFVVGGSQAVLHRHEDILRVLGKKIVWMGASGMGQAAKLVHNLTCGISLVAYCEALSLGEGFGLTRKQILDVLLAGAVASPLLNAKAAKFENGVFEPASMALANLSKDLMLAEDAAAGLHLELPALSVTKKLFEAGKMLGVGRKDTSALLQVFEQMAKNGA